ncbi:glycosyltransferase family 9 protein [Pantoea ananatis]|uniref:glycosyltransferase family 9 protein n=1 Tax=Pantoea ananas TaxID=553 RepID=UPI001D190731|nr:glycosyltransferase family 9 protein [Pantoea ananatis]UEG18244.1 glycosyltransferase family 9 protein [Pantoea ananatis]
MKNILVIRRDNIGDMDCTTQLLEGIKTAFPEAKLTLLVNKVAQDVILHNPHVDALHVYKKAKHRGKNETAIGVYWHRLKIFWALRKTKFDAAVLANPVPCKYSLRLARMAGAQHIIGAGEKGDGLTKCFDKGDFSGQHQVEQTFSYLTALTSLRLVVPDVRIYLTNTEKKKQNNVSRFFSSGTKFFYGIHISSRSAKRRWSLESYAQLIEKLLDESDAHILIFWSPQGTLDPNDPGDQARVEALLTKVNSERVAAYPTATIRELMAGFNCCKQILCSDGGQMHIAAALHKKQVVFFGDTDAALWHPWSGKHEILQTDSGESTDISVDQAWLAWQRLESI